MRRCTQKDGSSQEEQHGDADALLDLSKVDGQPIAKSMAQMGHGNHGYVKLE